MRRIDHIVIHCSATRASHDIGAAAINQWHLERGWSGIGYHFVIRRNGELEFGRPVEKVGAHVRGHNAYTIGVCMVGGLNEDGKPENNFTDAQFETALELCDNLVAKYTVNMRKPTVLGHRDFSEDLDGDGVIEPHEWMKACPCFDVTEWYYGAG